MDRRTLECFVALAEEAHFHRAAQRVHISQPGISHQLRKLEEELGVALMVRSNRHVSLTPAGQAFLSDARKIVTGMDDAARLARQIDQGILGALTVGSTASGLFIILPEIIATFQDRHPKVRVDVRHFTTDEQEAALRHGSIQAGICHPPITDRALDCTLLTTLPFNLVLNARHPLAKAESIRLSDLAEETFVMFPRGVGPRLYDSVIALCQQEGFSPARIVEAAPVQSIIAMAACGAGVGFVASRTQQLPRDNVVYRPLTGPAPYFTLGIVRRKTGSNPLVDAFTDAAAEIAAGLH